MVTGPRRAESAAYLVKTLRLDLRPTITNVGSFRGLERFDDAVARWCFLAFQGGHMDHVREVFHLRRGDRASPCGELGRLLITFTSRSLFLDLACPGPSFASSLFKASCVLEATDFVTFASTMRRVSLIEMIALWTGGVVSERAVFILRNRLVDGWKGLGYVLARRGPSLPAASSRRQAAQAGPGTARTQGLADYTRTGTRINGAVGDLPLSVERESSFDAPSNVRA